MKSLKQALRLVSLFRMPTLITRPKFNPYAITASGLATGYVFLFGSQKILTEEVATYEIEDNLQEGDMKEIQVGPKPEDTVLVVKYQGEYYCTQGKCSHFGFPLAKGLLVGDKVLCPLHNAGFDIKTGHPEQGPIIDGLKTFPVKR